VKSSQCKENRLVNYLGKYDGMTGAPFLDGYQECKADGVGYWKGYVSGCMELGNTKDVCIDIVHRKSNSNNNNDDDHVAAPPLDLNEAPPIK
jgi:hypothetical protein